MLSIFHTQQGFGLLKVKNKHLISVSSAILIFSLNSCYGIQSRVSSFQTKSLLSSHRISISKKVKLFIPANAINNQQINLVIQFRGVVPERFEESGLNAVVVACNTGGYSASMLREFGGKSFVDDMISQVKQVFQEKFAQNVVINRLALGSFSAGYEPLAAHLSNPNLVERLDAVIIIDGIHYGKPGQPDPKSHQPFVNFAQLAGRSKKLMVVTHSAIEPPYASAKDAADYMLKQLQISRHEPYQVKNSFNSRFNRTIKPNSVAQIGQFITEGYAGKTGRDHLEQLDNLSNIWLRYLVPRWSIAY